MLIFLAIFMFLWSHDFSASEQAGVLKRFPKASDKYITDLYAGKPNLCGVGHRFYIDAINSCYYEAKLPEEATREILSMIHSQSCNTQDFLHRFNRCKAAYRKHHREQQPLHASQQVLVGSSAGDHDLGVAQSVSLAPNTQGSARSMSDTQASANVSL